MSYKHPTLHLPSAIRPFYTVSLLSVLHAQPILHHYSLHYSFLVTWQSYITFTPNITFVLVGLPTLHNIFSNTRLTLHIISILHVQPILHHHSLRYSFAEWTSCITFTLNITFVLHGRPTFHVISILHTQPTLRFIYSYTWIAYTSIFALRITSMLYSGRSQFKFKINTNFNSALVGIFKMADFKVCLI